MSITNILHDISGPSEERMVQITVGENFRGGAEGAAPSLLKMMGDGRSRPDAGVVGAWMGSRGSRCLTGDQWRAGP